MSVCRLDPVEARRIAVRAQLLDAHRPRDLLAMVNHLTFLQLDPTAVVAPSADLVAWTRLRALGIARTSMVGQAGEPVEVKGTSGEWRVDPTAIGKPFTGRTALLSPSIAWSTTAGAQPSCSASTTADPRLRHRQ